MKLSSSGRCLACVSFLASLVTGTFAAAADLDGDGWEVGDGDCCDEASACPGANPAFINPGAFEVVGNSVDDDCDAATPDATAESACSAVAVMTGVTPEDLAGAMELCQSTPASPPLADRKWGLIDAEFLLASGATPSAAQLSGMANLQTAVLGNYGTGVTPQAGTTMAGLSNGRMRDQAQPGFVPPIPARIMATPARHRRTISRQMAGAFRSGRAARGRVPPALVPTTR